MKKLHAMSPPECEAAPAEAMVVGVTDAPSAKVRWVCTFEARAGAKARAFFTSARAAMQCAERHAGPQDLAFDWMDHPAGGLVLNTTVGFYRVESAHQTGV